MNKGDNRTVMNKFGFKFISIFIVIAMLLSAVACGDESETKVVKKKKVIDRYHEAESSSDESTSSDDSASGSGDDYIRQVSICQGQRKYN